MLAENSTSTAEISKRLVNFCSPKSRFFIKVSARRVEDEAKLVAASYPEPKRHLDSIKVSARRVEDEAKTCCSSLSRAEATLGQPNASAKSPTRCNQRRKAIEFVQRTQVKKLVRLKVF